MNITCMQWVLSVWVVKGYNADLICQRLWGLDLQNIMKFFPAFWQILNCRSPLVQLSEALESVYGYVNAFQISMQFVRSLRIS